MRDADLVLHCGDLMTEEALAEFERLGTPVLAVHGNVDSDALRRRLPAERSVDAGGVLLAMVHDAGPARGRMARLRRRFPDADAAVFGHSHVPLHERVDGFQIFNPGSPTDRRRQPRHTMGLATAEGGRISFELVPLD
jgi:putative phosphoesterase